MNWPLHLHQVSITSLMQASWGDSLENRSFRLEVVVTLVKKNNSEGQITITFLGIDCFYLNFSWAFLYCGFDSLGLGLRKVLLWCLLQRKCRNCSCIDMNLTDYETLNVIKTLTKKVYLIQIRFIMGHTRSIHKVSFSTGTDPSYWIGASLLVFGSMLLESLMIM